MQRAGGADGRLPFWDRDSGRQIWALQVIGACGDNKRCAIVKPMKKTSR